jgi:hypothetical protein
MPAAASESAIAPTARLVLPIWFMESSLRHAR